MRAFVPVLRLEQLAQRHLDFAAVGDLDADGVLAGNGREDVDALGAGRAREVALERDDLVHAHALGGIDLVARDRRAFGDVARRDADPELHERVDEDRLDRAQFLRVRRGASVEAVGFKQAEIGQRIVFKMRRLVGDKLFLFRLRLGFLWRGNRGIDDLRLGAVDGFVEQRVGHRRRRHAFLLSTRSIFLVSRATRFSSSTSRSRSSARARRNCW